EDTPGLESIGTSPSPSPGLSLDGTGTGPGPSTTEIQKCIIWY
ncbi:unnamed protein product, partial [Adineta ricciae]